MTMDLRGRSHLSELDFTAAEPHHLLDLAADLKAARRGGTERPRLTGGHLALLFEKTSTRTRRAFEVAGADQGAATTYPGPGDTHMRAKEPVADTARVVGRTFDAIEYRGSAQSTVTELAAHSGVPVHNGLTDTAHPIQSLCDVLTMREHTRKPLPEIARPPRGRPHQHGQFPPGHGRPARHGRTHRRPHLRPGGTGSHRRGLLLIRLPRLRPGGERLHTIKTVLVVTLED